MATTPSTTAASSVGTFNFAGLATGLDTSAIIDQLMAVDSKPLTRLESNQTDLTNKKDAYTTMKSDLVTLQNSVSDLKTSAAFSVFSASSSDEEALTLTALSSAREGNYRVTIRSLAQAKALSGNSFEAVDTPLGNDGEILVNGKALKVRSSDTLQDIANGVNGLKNGVDATVLKVSDGDNRLILSAESQGKKGFLISNAGGTDILGKLGFTDGTKHIRESSNGAVLSASFSTATSTVGSIAGISSKAAGKVKIRNQSVSIDLSTDTLSSIRDKINALGIQGVSANVVSSKEDNATVYRLSVKGTQEFTDDGNVLESLGILDGGTDGVKAAFQTSVISDAAGKIALSASTKLTNLGAAQGNGGAETVKVTGTNEDGTAVSRSISIGKTSTVGDLLSGIEDAFSGHVTASLEDGKITVESATAGESKLSVNIEAMNEAGGTLDFGAMSTVNPGRLRLLSGGTDAEILVNNTTVTRSSNEINDAVTGLALTLKKADPSTELVLTVSRDTDSIKTKIEGFVKSYNDLYDFIDTNSKYDKEKDTSGPLMGDMTSQSVIRGLRNTLQQTFGSNGFDFTQLFQIGIEFNSTGHLQINSEKLTKAFKTDIDSLTNLFTVTRSSSDSRVAFSYNSVKTKPGTYSVNITSAAEKATVGSSGQSTASGSGTLALADNLGSGMSVAVAKGDNSIDIANRINVEAAKTYQKIFQSGTGLTGADQTPITQNTDIADIGGVKVKDGDTITVNVTDHSGRTFQRRILLSSAGSTTMEDVLSAVESMTDNDASASIDTQGRIRVQDKETGTSRLNVSMSSTVAGLDFGSFSVLQEGRNTVMVEASTSESGALVLLHKGYGTQNTFTVKGGAAVGIADGVYAGKDVAGKINGVIGTGNGQSLTASASDPSSQGITISSSITSAELAGKGGSSSSTITLVSGAADSLYRAISSLTDTVGGFVQTKIDSFDRSIRTSQNDIADMNSRLDQRKDYYTRKFADLERSLSLLQSVQQQLTATLSALPAAKL
jgi:flagellar hook-associated protein 2